MKREPQIGRDGRNFALFDGPGRAELVERLSIPMTGARTALTFPFLLARALPGAQRGRRDTAGYGGIRRDMAGYDEIRSGMARYIKIPQRFWTHQGLDGSQIKCHSPDIHFSTIFETPAGTVKG